MWRSTFVDPGDDVQTFYPSEATRFETDTTCWTILTHSDEVNWNRRWTFHELNSLSLVRLMQSSTFRLIFGVNLSTFCQPFVSGVAGTCVQLLSTRRPSLRTFVASFLPTQLSRLVILPTVIGWLSVVTTNDRPTISVKCWSNKQVVDSSYKILTEMTCNYDLSSAKYDAYDLNVLLPI